MSKFYGQVFGAGKSPATRRGHNLIKVSAQSYDGSVITALNYYGDELYVNIGYNFESSDKCNDFVTMPFEKFVELINNL